MLFMFPSCFPISLDAPCVKFVCWGAPRGVVGLDLGLRRSVGALGVVCFEWVRIWMARNRAGLQVN
eukprot:14924657-Alexandrium_andersonii.AAC.1